MAGTHPITGGIYGPPPSQLWPGPPDGRMAVGKRKEETNWLGVEEIGEEEGGGGGRRREAKETTEGGGDGRDSDSKGKREKFRE